MKYVSSKRWATKFLLVMITCILTSCAGSKNYTSAKEKRELFELFFGFAPPETIRDIEGRRVWVGDTLSDWIRVPCDPSLFERIITVTNATRFDRAQLAESWKHELPDLDRTNPNSPSWWPTNPSRNIEMLFHKKRPYSKERGEADELYFWRDSQTGIVFAHYVAWR